MDKINLTAVSICVNQLGVDNLQELAEHRLEAIFQALPSGSGIDAGIQLNDKSTAQKIMFNFGFHHMNENGYYEGWTEHKLTITPNFGSFDIRISGTNRNGIKEYLYDLFYDLFKVTDITESFAELNKIISYNEFKESKQ